MKSFNGQLTAHGQNGGPALVWQDVPFYVKAFLIAKVRFRSLLSAGVE